MNIKEDYVDVTSECQHEIHNMPKGKSRIQFRHNGLLIASLDTSGQVHIREGYTIKMRSMISKSYNEYGFVLGIYKDNNFHPIGWLPFNTLPQNLLT